MGCNHSNKTNPKSDDDMAVQLGGKFELPTPINEDPRLPLTVRQVFKLKQSWKGIRRNMKETGVELFLSLFSTNEDLKNMFSAFKNLESSDELRSADALQAHGLLVMGILDDAISHIDNVDEVFQIVNRASKTHRAIKNFSPDLFWFVEQPFLDAVKLVLGDRYTENMENIYKIVIKFLATNLVKATRGETL